MMREAFLSPSKRHFDRSCGVVIVLVRYTRAPSITQISVSVPPLSMLMSRFASPDVSSAGAPPLSTLTSLLNSPEVSSVAFIIDSPSRVAETHQRRVGLQCDSGTNSPQRPPPYFTHSDPVSSRPYLYP